VVLLVLLAISVVGPMLGIRVVTLLTAFGIAIVKAYLVAKNFMHINVARRYVAYLVATSLVFMLLLFAGVAPDVMKADGTNWTKPLWHETGVDITARDPAGAHGGGGHGDAHGAGEH
jgi:caa(3)-type oxidase subunit IV